MHTSKFVWNNPSFSPNRNFTKFYSSWATGRKTRPDFLNGTLHIYKVKLLHAHSTTISRFSQLVNIEAKLGDQLVDLNLFTHVLQCVLLKIIT
jgi:hypothetical protein